MIQNAMTDGLKAGYDARLELIISKIEKQNPNADTTIIRNAYDFAFQSHLGQVRRSGEPYIMHPLAVAEIALDIGLFDVESIVAALLHDVIEDTSHTFDEIKQHFGIHIAEIVDGVSKLTRVQYTYKEDEQMENLRKMFLAMSKDIRVILTKIADRLHNMRTSEHWGESKRREKALETMEIYAPLAYRLGMQRVKLELEDIALKCLDPIGYAEITSAVDALEKNYSHFLDNIRDRLQQKLDELGIKAEIHGRVKHVYSIYRKMYNQHKTLAEIYDLYAVRIIVDDLEGCYAVLGIVHELYKTVPGRFKDYISTPKPNMYQSIHTTVIGREGLPFEVQIRTWDMHRTAEYGIAAHWKYKDNVHDGGTDSVDFDNKLEWVRRLLEAQEDSDADEFLSNLKIDMFADEVFVFTPGGDVKNLPAGATPIDFAYTIHSAVGNRMNGAKVNGRIVGYDYQLQNGDIVEILTSKAEHGPRRGWLELARTSEAKNKIRQWFKREKRDENIMEGKQRLDEQLAKLDISPSDLTDDILPQILKRVSFGSLDELYAAIGYGGISVMRASNRIKDELTRIGKLRKEPAKVAETLPKRLPKRTDSGVIVEGVDNCLVKFARCCTPVPGDDIIGFVTRGNGVSVHLKSCDNVENLGKSHEKGRWINVFWAEETNDRYITGIQLNAKDRPNLVVDIMNALSVRHIPAVSLNARLLNDGYSSVDLAVEVLNLDELRQLMTKLGTLRGVVQVNRKGYEG